MRREELQSKKGPIYVDLFGRDIKKGISWGILHDKGEQSSVRSMCACVCVYTMRITHFLVHPLPFSKLKGLDYVWSSVWSF